MLNIIFRLISNFISNIYTFQNNKITMEEQTDEINTHMKQIIPINNPVKRDENSIVYNSFSKFVSMRWDNNIINVYENEKKWLQLFKFSKHLPKLIYFDDLCRCIITQYCGQQINIDNIPLNIIQQAEDILYELEQYNCKHNDIKPEELLIYKGTLYLVDFGWGHEINKPIPHEWPICLGGQFRSPIHYELNDRYSMYFSLNFIFCNIIKQIINKHNTTVLSIQNKLNKPFDDIYKKEVPQNLDSKQEIEWWKEYINSLSKPTIYYL